MSCWSGSCFSRAGQTLLAHSFSTFHACEWGRSDLGDLWEIDQQQIARDDMFSMSWVQTNLSF